MPGTVNGARDARGSRKAGGVRRAGSGFLGLRHRLRGTGRLPHVARSTRAPPRAGHRARPTKRGGGSPFRRQLRTGPSRVCGKALPRCRSRSRVDDGTSARHGPYQRFDRSLGARAHAGARSDTRHVVIREGCELPSYTPPICRQRRTPPALLMAEYNEPFPASRNSSNEGHPGCSARNSRSSPSIVASVHFCRRPGPRTRPSRACGGEPGKAYLVLGPFPRTSSTPCAREFAEIVAGGASALTSPACS